ncbi:MAG: hypothetical protein RRA94_06395, partial [Bacteroidota bacterium]|nr:hypothetical protein [Bacteroidota bacterium]
GGFLEGGADEQLSDITDSSTASGNHGWYELGRLLRADGFLLTQLTEGPAEDNTAVPLAARDLRQYDVIVFGSNNAEYSEADVDSVEAYIRGGGAALFISDANWGRNWGDAPSSDQQFLDRFGLVMNQDRGVYALMRDMDHFVVDGDDRGGHPVLDGVNAFDGEGVSPITIARTVSGVTANVLARALQPVQQNDSSGAGSVRAATSADGALVVAEAGSGRIAGHFDRNTFFNANGAGSSLHRFDNARYARNLFAWLSGKQPTRVALLPGTSDNEVLHMRLHPMPARSSLTLQLRAVSTRTVSLGMRDVHGRMHWSADAMQLQAGTWRSIDVSVAGLTPGTYFLSVHAATTTAVRRIVVMR